MGQITVRLVDENADEKFCLERESSNIPEDQQAFVQYFNNNASVRGLHITMRGNGAIELGADVDQLSASMIAAIRNDAEAALQHVAESSKR